MSKDKADKAERLAMALRANLHRRKAQARAGARPVEESAARKAGPGERGDDSLHGDLDGESPAA